jgi:thiosulfate reductase / polysulfide reductase chain A
MDSIGAARETPTRMQRVVPSTCWECGTLCGALVTLDGDRVVKVAPNPEHPHSKGAFCVKGIRALPEWTSNDQRLRHPMRRVGERGAGRFERVSWDDALDTMAQGLAPVRKQYGPLAIAAAVSGAFFSRGPAVALLMRSIGSPNWMINQDLCHGCRALSDRITGIAVGKDDVDRAKNVLIIGANPHAADPVTWTALKRAKARGARIATLDPFRSPVADLAELWLRPKPGTDAAIGLAMIDVLIRERLDDADFVAQWCHGFDKLAERAALYPPERAAAISGVPAADIVAAARLYADGPSAMVTGHGIDAMSNGVQTFRVFHALLAISGNLDRAGGNIRVKRPKGLKTNFDLLHDRAYRLPLEVEWQRLGARQYPLWSGPEGWQAACHNPTVIEAMLTGKPYPVRALYATGVNIAVTYPDSRRTLAALRSLDFLAVASQHMTPTAAIADVVLPKTTTLEEEDVTLDPHGPCVTYTAALKSPEGEAKTDIEIAYALIQRLKALGAIDQDRLPWPTQRAYNEFLIGDSGLSLDSLAEQGYATFPYELGNFATQGFRTPTGKLELYSETLAKLGLDPLPDYVPPAKLADHGADFPLLLQTGLREKSYHHSRFRDQAWAKKVAPDPWARLHPNTAARHGIAEGDWIWVETARGQGRCRLRAELTEQTEDGVVATGMGWWRPDAPAPDHGVLDININAALSYAGPYDPMSGSPDSRALPCRIGRIEA